MFLTKQYSYQKSTNQTGETVTFVIVIMTMNKSNDAMNPSRYTK